jgi:hypothetical protein
MGLLAVSFKYETMCWAVDLRALERQVAAQRPLQGGLRGVGRSMAREGAARPKAASIGLLRRRAAVLLLAPRHYDERAIGQGAL